MPEPFPPRLTGRPFTRSESTAFGLTARQLDARRVLRLHHGVRLVPVAGDPTALQRTASALKVLPADTLVTGVTGLRLFGVEVGPEVPVSFCSTHPYPVRRPGIVVSRTTQLPPHTGRLAAPADCFAAAATELGLVDAVAAGDWLLHLRLATLADLAAAVDRRSRRNVRRARRALALVRTGVESPRESKLRLVLVLAGLPEPRPNVTLRSADGLIGRADLLYEAYRLVIEYDGLQHLSDRAQWESDIQRVERFTDAGHHVIRVTAARMANPRRLVLDVHRTLVARGYSGAAPTFTPEWMTCFAR